MEFPTFKYSDIKFNPEVFTGSIPGLSIGTTSGTSTGFPSTDLTLDQALAYGVMQSLDPEKRSKARKEELFDLLALQKEQMKEAYPYMLSRQIPEQISQAFGNAQAIRLLGSQLGQQAAMEGVGAIARGQFAPYSTLNEFKYFS